VTHFLAVIPGLAATDHPAMAMGRGGNVIAAQIAAQRIDRAHELQRSRLA